MTTVVTDERLRWNCECSKPPYEGEEVLGNDGAIRCPNCQRPLSGDPEPSTASPQTDQVERDLKGRIYTILGARVLDGTLLGYIDEASEEIARAAIQALPISPASANQVVKSEHGNGLTLPDEGLRRKLARISNAVAQHREAPFRSADWLALEVICVLEENVTQMPLSYSDELGGPQ